MKSHGRKSKETAKEEERIEKEPVLEAPVAEAPFIMKESVFRKLAQQVGKVFWLTKPERGVSRRPWFEAESLTAVTSGIVLKRYDVGQAEVVIADEGGRGRYLVLEPTLSAKEREVYKQLLENIFYGLEPSYEPFLKAMSPDKYIEGALWDSARDLGFLEEVKASASKYLYYIKRDGLGYGKLHVLMTDPQIEDVSMSSYLRPVSVMHRRYNEYGWLDTNITFASEVELRSYSQRAAQRVGRTLTAAIPVVDCYDGQTGARLAFTYGNEVSYPGTTFNIRKLPSSPYTLVDLVENGTISPLVGAYLWKTIEFKGFLLVLGGSGAGKTTLVNAVLLTVPRSQKVATIEETLELLLAQEGAGEEKNPNWLRLHARTGYSLVETRFDVSLMDLTKISMRHRPSFISVGEVRGEEIEALVHAAALGHGCLSSLHAYSPAAALTRMRAPPMNVAEGGLMLVWSFAQMAWIKMPGERWARRVMSVEEVVPGEKLSLTPMFRWYPRSDEFSPTKAKDVVRSSPRLKAAANAQGLTEHGLVRDLEQKAELLETMCKEKRFGFEQFVEEINKRQVKT